MAKASGRVLLLEVIVVTAVLMGLLRLLMTFTIGPIHEYSSLIFLVMAVYGPIMLLKKRRRSVGFVETSLGTLVRSLGVFCGYALVIFPLYLLAAHVWQEMVYDLSLRLPIRHWPSWELWVGQILLIALPEEFFFRGYVQSTLDQVFRPRWKLFGASVGWSWIVTALIFAAAHSAILVRWWHFAIFFPALAFGFLRARTGGILAPVLFHATANVVAWWLGANYA